MEEVIAPVNNQIDTDGIPHRDMWAISDFVDKIEDIIRFQERVDKPTDVHSIWEIIVDEVRHYVDVSVSSLFLVDPDTNGFEPVATEPDHASAPCHQEFESQVECGTFSWVVDRKQPSVIPSLVMDKEQSLILIPLVASNRTIGMILLLSPITNNSVTWETLKILRILGKQCSFVMCNALLYKQLSQIGSIF